MRRLAAASVILLGTLGFVACGGGDDAAAYCDAVASSEASEAPTQEEIDEVRDSAPDEIASEVDTIADALEEFLATGDATAFENDADLQAAVEATEEYEAEHCDS